MHLFLALSPFVSPLFFFLPQMLGFFLSFLFFFFLSAGKKWGSNILYIHVLEIGPESSFNCLVHADLFYSRILGYSWIILFPYVDMFLK